MRLGALIIRLPGTLLIPFSVFPWQAEVIPWRDLSHTVGILWLFLYEFLLARDLIIRFCKTII